MHLQRLVKWLLIGVVTAPAAYLAAMIIGAVVPGVTKGIAEPAAANDNVKIYLLTGPLHADIAVPVDSQVLQQFGFLDQSGINLNDNGLHYLVFGWGSEAFYTIAGTYADITAAATLRAVTGDSSVMHVVPVGRINQAPDTIPLTVSRGGYSRLLTFLRSSFDNSTNGEPQQMPGKSHGYGDVFYRGRGGFNIFYPCNAWAGDALRTAGVKLGIWTPTTFSLKLSLKLYGR